MPGLAHGSVLISMVVVMFAALLIATPTLAVLKAPHEMPILKPVTTSYVSALA